MAFSLLDQGDGYAKSGMGQVDQAAGRKQPWLYMFEIYSGHPKDQGTERGDYDILWLDRGSIPGKTLPWVVRYRKGSSPKMLGSVDSALPFDTLNSVKVPILNSGASAGTPADSAEFSAGFANLNGLMVMRIGNKASGSKSPFVSTVTWYPKELVGTFSVRVISGVPTTVLPDTGAGASTFSIVGISNQLANASTSLFT